MLFRSVYASPILRIRQEFDLHTNFRPCKAYKGNPLNYRDDIDLAIFRENTEGLYSGIEFFPLPQELRDSLLKNNPKMERFKNTPLDEIALSCRFITKKLPGLLYIKDLNMPKNIIKNQLLWWKNQTYYGKPAD